MFELPRVDIYLSSKLGRLGEKVARNPLQYLGFGLLLIALFSTGLQQFEYESNPGYLFVPSDARSYKERQVVEKWFPQKLDSRFVRGAESKFPMITEIAITPLYGDEILNKDIWREAFNLNKAIQTIQVTSDEDLFMWSNLCARFDGECVGNDVLSLHDRLDQVNLTYPLMKDPLNNKIYPMLAHIGGVTLDGNDLISGKALKISFIIDSSSKRKEKAGHIFTQVVRLYASSINFQHIKVAAITDMTLEEELSATLHGILDKIPLTLVLVLSFSIYNCLSTDWVRSKPWIGVISVLVSALAFSSASGLALYLGVKWQAINIICLSLTLGIGLDDTFVMLSAWWRSELTCGRDVTSRISATYSEAAVSITVTSLTNVISFLVGALVPGFPAVRIFCFYTALCMTFMYLWTLFILGPCITMAGHLEHANRHCLFFIRVDSKSEAELYRGWFYPFLFQGGVGKKAGNARDNKEGKFMTFFRDVIAKQINKSYNKVIILLCFAAYLAASIYGITQLDMGLERNKLIGHDSYAMKFYDAEDKYFRDNPYRFQIIIEDELEYWNKTVRDSIFEFVHKLEDSGFITADPEFRQSWLHQFMEKVEDNFLFFDISTKKKFIDNLISFLEVVEDTPIFDDVIFSSDNSTILASRFFLQSSRIKDAKEEVVMLSTLRQIVDDAPFKATIYHPFFSLFDQFAQVTRTTLECVVCCVICMTIVTAIFIPDKRSIIWVTFTIISVEVGIVGFMALIGIRLDVISMIVIIMGIGFSVDFSAHISYHYLTSGCDLSASSRVEHCLYALGPPIIRGGASTILGVISLYFHPNYIPETFSTMILLIISLGLVHSLLLLPVLLSLFGPAAKYKKSENKLNSPSTLSETFTYQASLSPNPMRKKKSESLRKLVLGVSAIPGFQDIDRNAECLDNTDFSIGSWNKSANTPEFHKLIVNRLKHSGVDLNNVEKNHDVNMNDISNIHSLPYYKFAHVKRSAKISRVRSFSDQE